MNRWYGVLAAVAGLAMSELVAGLLGARLSPVLAVGEWVIAATPGVAAEQAIDTVGRADKPILVAGVVVVVLALGAVLGAWWDRRRSLAVAGYVVLTAVAVVAVLSLPGSRPAEAASALAAGGTAVLVMSLLARTPTAEPDGAAEPAAGPDPDRRRFLAMAGLVLAGSALAVAAGEWAGRSRRAVESARGALRLGGRATPPPGADLGVAGVNPWLTPNRDFYRIDTALAPPLITPEDWQLRIHGMVDREMTVTYQDLLDRGLQDAWVTLCCVSNPVGGDLVGNTRWSGVPIKDLLEEAGVHAGADALLSTSHDGWTCGTPLEPLLDGRNALLAVAMDGEPLPVDHGFPARQVVPGLYGYVSATKWVTDWEVTRFADFSAYWTDRGWSERGPVKTQSRIDTPDGAQEPGRVVVAGVAWAQHRGIEKVEVRVDGGPWQQARLGEVPNEDTWVQWSWDGEATTGEHRIEVRATDGDGSAQTSERADVVPDGATGYDSTTVTVA